VEDKGFHRNTVNQSVRFALVGLLNTAVDFGTFFVMVRFLHWNVILAQSVSYACGILNSYLCNRYLTFAHRNPPKYSEILKFITLNGVSYGISVCGLSMLRKLLWPLVLCKVASTLVAFVVNFIGNKWWVFRNTKHNSVAHGGE
jgi:putative flippase GtrA